MLDSRYVRDVRLCNSSCHHEPRAAEPLAIVARYLETVVAAPLRDVGHSEAEFDVEAESFPVVVEIFDQDFCIREVVHGVGLEWHLLPRMREQAVPVVTQIEVGGFATRVLFVDG